MTNDNTPQLRIGALIRSKDKDLLLMVLGNPDSVDHFKVKVLKKRGRYKKLACIDFMLDMDSLAHHYEVIA